MAACQPGSDSDKQAAPKQVVPNENPIDDQVSGPKASSEASVTVSVDRDSEPSAITVRITKDNSSFGIESVERLDVITGYSVNVPVSGVDVVDHVNSPRSDLRPWHYKYIIQTNRGQLVKEVRVLKDWVLAETARISDFKIESNRIEVRFLVLKEGAVLITEGRDLQIDAAELRSGSIAHIQTFSDKDLELSNTVKVPGQGGGRLILNLKYATGVVKIQMRGHRGSRGEKGVDATQERPAQAAAGTAGEYFAGFPRGPDYDGERPSCSKHPTDGQRGTNGVAGADGFNGFQGGSSGSLYLTLQSARFFDYEVVFVPGEGGEGGEGGKGQPGGLGGQAGASAPLCRKAKAGADGANGAVGSKGQQGSVGTLGEFCLTMGDKGTSCITRDQFSGGVK
ncbi:hypothetical protein Bdt_3610 [Bdellovibrio bacteriovorus str. Tiberius]|uniref:Uncharacterized protein n=1 Tax=Bdellovibrio bacteriovorus str. Tiberius TaxID=1069642 RepID=K7Z2E1_BDEBC|nr:hypothetical protein Bdt_3610 [Bdellovibrio bacteriovorus str. Tiberius]